MDKGEITSYRDLRVWQNAMALTEACYRVTQNFPREELFGLTSQIRRAATSIAANIAEGYGRELTRSFIQFLRIAQGSLKKLETHLMIARRVGIAEGSIVEGLLRQCDELGRMLRSMIRALQRKETGA